MISAATLDELAGYATRGRIGSVIDLRCSDPHPEAESEVLVEWENDVGGVLEIPGIGRFAAPAVGQRRIGVSGDPITVRLTANDEVAEVRISPRIFVPRVELRVAERIILGVPSRLVWQSNAEACTLRLTDGDSVQEGSFGASGGLDFVARNLGELRIELNARGRHAHLSPDIGTTTRTQTIQVVAPPIIIDLNASEKSALIGDEVTFSWKVSGAREVRIEALQRRETLRVPTIGHLIAEVGGCPERFRLVATGLDGGQKSVEFRVVPRMLNVSHIPCDLKYLNLPWE